MTYAPTKDREPFIKDVLSLATMAPIEEFSIDYASIDGQDYLVSVDRASGFITTWKMPTTTTGRMIE